MKSLRSTGSETAARASVRNSGAPWNEGVSVNTERQVAPPGLVGLGEGYGLEVGADEPLGGRGLLDLGDERWLALGKPGFDGAREWPHARGAAGILRNHLQRQLGGRGGHLLALVTRYFLKNIGHGGSQKGTSPRIRQGVGGCYWCRRTGSRLEAYSPTELLGFSGQKIGAKAHAGRGYIVRDHVDPDVWSPVEMTRLVRDTTYDPGQHRCQNQCPPDAHGRQPLVMAMRRANAAAAAPLSIEAAARTTPSARSVARAADQQRRAGVEQYDVAIRAGLARQHGPERLGIGLGVTASEVGKRGGVQPYLARVDLEGAHLAARELGDEGRACRGQLIEPVAAVHDPEAHSVPRLRSTSATGLTQRSSNTPTIWRFTRAGLQIGPSRLNMVRTPRSALTGAQALKAGWCIGAHRKPTPASRTARATVSTGTSILTPRAARTSEAPESEETERLPCFATFRPAPAATKAAQVETL